MRNLRRFLVVSGALLFLGVNVGVAFAFNGPPPGSPPTGNGSIITDSSNRVGIGAAIPVSIFTIGSSNPSITVDTLSGSDTKFLTLSGGGDFNAARGATIKLYGVNAAANAGDAYLYSGTGGDILLIPSGNVGIGTTNPTQKLTVAGNVDIGANYLALGTVTTDSRAGLYWSTLPGQYSIYRSPGPWVPPNYQQLTLDWPTGIVMNPGTVYGESYVDIQGGGLRVTAGNVGIGTAAPDTNLEVYGSTANYSNSIRYYRNVAHYNAVGAVTGTMKIAMPKSWSNTIMIARIQGYNYSSNGGAWEVVVSGHSDPATPAWYSHSAEIRGTAPFSQVRLAHDGTNNIILLGNVTTAWFYPRAVVSEFIASHSDFTGWGSGWVISMITNETGIVNSVTPTIRTYITSAGNVGIGKVNPAQKLDVAGTAQMTGLKLTTGPASGYVLTSDAAGNGTWQAVSASGDITGIITPAGSGVTGGSLSGDVTLGLDATVARTNAANTFGAFNQTFDTNVLVVDATNNRVGVNVTPTTALDVAGQIKISGGSPGAGKVLTSDAAGLATWATPAGGANYTVVKFTTSGSSGVVTASCPAGTKVFGGGCYGYYSNCRLRDTLPQSVILGDASEGWYCSFWQRGSDALCGGPGQNAYVVCM